MSAQKLTKETILRELGDFKASFSDRYGVKKIGLFGSFVRDEARSDSDIDVVVELSDPDLFALVHIKEELENGFHRPVDVISYSPLMNSYLQKRIAEEAVYV